MMPHQLTSTIGRFTLGIAVFGIIAPFVNAEEVPKIPLDRLAAFETHDWDADNTIDRALLVNPSDEETGGFDLYIVRGTGAWLRVPDFASGGAMMGLPRLSVNEFGSLVVTSSNLGIGRGHWEKRIVIAYRDSQFLVAGCEFESHDTLEVYPDVNFSVNYLTGKTILDGKETSGPPQAIPLADWVAPEEYR